MFPIFDLAVYQQHVGKPDELIAAKIWAGPYTVTKLNSDVMEMVPSEHWYAGKPKLDHVQVRFITDPQARILAVRNGEADLALYPPSTTARELQGRSDAYYVNQPKGTAIEGFQLLLNIHAAPIDDLAVRKALRNGIDYKSIAEEVLNGLYDTSVGMYPAFLPYALHDQKTDTKAAESALDDAGWAKGSDGVRAKDGKRLTFELLTYPQQPDTKTIAVAVQAQLAELGFDVKVKQVDDATAVVEQPTGWTAAVMGNSLLDWTGSDAVGPLVNNFMPDADGNYGRVDDPKLTSLIEKLRGAFDEGERNQMLEDAQKIIVEDNVYTLYLALKRVPVVASPKLRDYRVPPAALLFLNDYE
jgi:peptide/nickel transport system substrate-binding protein